MVRPCFLIVDREYSGNISTRKLIVETAKFNVITAYSGAETLETVERYPAVDGVVLDAGIRDMDAPDVVAELKRRYPSLPVITISAPGSKECPGADYHLENFDPVRLLALLQSLCPRETAAIQARTLELMKEEEENER